jgi:hypothetical protein
MMTVFDFRLLSLNDTSNFQAVLNYFIADRAYDI